MTLVLSILGAIAAGMVVQGFLAYRQAQAFQAAVRELKLHGTVAVGSAGKRYRGGRAFVAIASDDNGRVTKAVSLTGFTTFARPAEVSNVRGLRLSQLRGKRPIDAIGPGLRSAIQNAAETLSQHLAPAI